MSKPLLLAAFYLFMTPAAYVLRQFGYDPMALRQWKQGTTSAFVDRNHQYTSNDLNSPR